MRREREKAEGAKMSEGDPRVSQIFLHDRLSNLPTRCADVEFRQETSIRMRNGTGLSFYGCFRVIPRTLQLSKFVYQKSWKVPDRITKHAVHDSSILHFLSVFFFFFFLPSVRVAILDKLYN